MTYACDGLGGFAYHLHLDDTCGGEPVFSNTFEGIRTGVCIEDEDSGGHYMITCPGAGSDMLTATEYADAECSVVVMREALPQCVPQCSLGASDSDSSDSAVSCEVRALSQFVQVRVQLGEPAGCCGDALALIDVCGRIPRRCVHTSP